jgi:membrane-associated protein
LEIIQFFIELLSDPRKFIVQWIAELGPIWVYTPLFIIIFVETGLVVTPFLPGDSLLFAAGVFAAPGMGLNLMVLLVCLYIAAILGNTSNYWIGRKIGQAIIDSGRVKALTPERIAKTQAMFDKYGLLAVVLTRFFPIIRTFAPFLAGVGGMHFGRFTLFNVLGGVLWVTIFTLIGYFFGNIPFVQENFELIIIAIVVISFIPTVVGAVKLRMGSKRAKSAKAAKAAERTKASEGAERAEASDATQGSDATEDPEPAKATEERAD